MAGKGPAFNQTDAVKEYCNTLTSKLGQSLEKEHD